MYKCQLCGAQSKPGEGARKVVAEVRKRTYENVVRRGKKEYTKRSEGAEIVREVTSCAPCAAPKAA